MNHESPKLNEKTTTEGTSVEIKINLDLPTIIGSAVSAERLQPIIDKAIAEAIKDAITEATGYCSTFRAGLKKQLGEALPSGLTIDDCAKFQQMLNAAVTDAVQSENSQVIKAALRTAAKSVMPEVPARIKVSQLIKEARSGFYKEDHEAFYAKLELSDYGGGTLFLDSNEDHLEQWRAEIRISFNKDGDVFSLHVNGHDITPKSIPDAIGGFDGLLLSMYVGRTSLELDCDESDVESAAEAQLDI